MALNNPVPVLGELAVGMATVPVQNVDGTVVPFRGDVSGAAVVSPRYAVDRQCALEGKSYVAFNPTIGTGVTENAVSTGFVDTVGRLVIRNNATGTGPILLLKYYKNILTTTTTAIVSVDLVVKLDNIVRSPSTLANGTNAIPVNVNPAFGNSSVASVIGFNATGDMTIPAAGPAARVVGRCHLPTGIGLVGDEYIFQFGGADHQASPALTAAKATAPGRYVSTMSAVVIPPGWSAILHRWSLTEAAVTAWEWELAWDEI